MKTKPDIVHAWQDQTNITASIAALMAGVPGIVLFARSQRPDRKTMMHIRNRPYLKKAYDAILQHPNVLLCLNSSAGSKSYAEWLGRKEKEFPVIHNGVDFKSLSDASADADLNKIIRKLGITKKATIVGSVFRFVKEKQPEIWVEAMQKVIKKQPNVHAIIVGDGGLKNATQKIINEKGLEKSIHLVGQTREVAAWLGRFDLFLLTSMVEGLPNVLIEAQAFGVPVVSTNAGGSADTFIDGKTGKLCESHDPEVIANTVLSCIQDEKWLSIASKASSTHGRKAFGTKPMLKRLMQIYETSLERQINSK
jgi:glycosyltransferase involved in cell wall biosynthesis